MKKFLLIIPEYIFIFIVSFLVIDIFVSNTFLNLENKTCKKVEKNYLELKKNCKGKEKIRAFLSAVNIFTDERGLRIKKNHIRTNNEKVFVFGSSFIYGAGIEYEKSVIGIMEKKHKNFEFYNFSQPWGSPTFHLYRLKQNLKNNEKPKKIILVLSMSDILNETDIWGDYDESGKPILINKNIYEKSKINEKFYKRHFRISRSIILNFRNKLRSLKNKNNESNPNEVRTTIQAGFTYTPLEQLKKFYTEDSFKKGKNKIKKRIDEMLIIAQQKNIEFYLAIFPFADTLEYGQDYFNWENFAYQLCSTKDCKFVNSFPDYNKYKNMEKNWYKNLFFVGDEHFTELGHQILAEKFTKQIF